VPVQQNKLIDACNRISSFPPVTLLSTSTTPPSTVSSGRGRIRTPRRGPMSWQDRPSFLLWRRTRPMLLSMISSI
jgi:hypothetical protein